MFKKAFLYSPLLSVFSQIVYNVTSALAERWGEYGDMRHRIKEIWRNIGLTGKLNLIILLSICFVSLAGLASIRYLTVCYNEELYEKNAMALKYITSDLETELKAISTMTDYMVADETVQYNLCLLYTSRSSSQVPQMRIPP